MKRSLFLGMCIIIAASQVAAKDVASKVKNLGEFSFMGHKYGESRDELMAVIGGNIDDGKISSWIGDVRVELDRCRKSSGGCGMYAEIGGVKGFIHFDIRDDRLSSVSVTLSNKFQYTELREMLIGKYGKPRRSNVEESQNMYGAKFRGRVDEWEFSDGLLEYREIGSKVDEASLLFYSTKNNDGKSSERSAATGRKTF